MPTTAGIKCILLDIGTRCQTLLLLRSFTIKEFFFSSSAIVDCRPFILTDVFLLQKGRCAPSHLSRILSYVFTPLSPECQSHPLSRALAYRHCDDRWLIVYSCPQFPYAIKALPGVLAAKWDDAEFKTYRDAFPEDARQSPQALQAHVEDLTKRDVKVAALKNLQGYLWEDGYKSGAYATDLFPDVVPQLQRWKEDGHALAIYSSGSVFAQKLLFGHVRGSSPSDLTHLFVGWFDTVNAGLKTEAASYGKIAAALKVGQFSIVPLSKALTLCCSMILSKSSFLVTTSRRSTLLIKRA